MLLIADPSAAFPSSHGPAAASAPRIIIEYIQRCKIGQTRNGPAIALKASGFSLAQK